ncbi:MAG TPA: hypothetical protein PKX25_16805 [Microthrixaceae bacterium]|nr:hypothetical protein [Microthrixaceae bacterium]
MSPDPLADPAATITRDRVRVTVLTPRLLRLEYAPDARFDDRATWLWSGSPTWASQL